MLAHALALAHKGLDVETVPWRFTDKDRLAFSGQGRVPVLVDGDRVVSDSWAIAAYLEDRYPDRPSLFGGTVGQAHARFINAWADQVVQPGIARLMVRDIIDVLAPEDVDYFRASRERAFGATLEAVVGRSRDTCRGVAGDAGAGAAGAARAAFPGRRGAELCRPHPVRQPAMAALHQCFSFARR